MPMTTPHLGNLHLCIREQKVASQQGQLVPQNQVVIRGQIVAGVFEARQIENSLLVHHVPDVDQLDRARQFLLMLQHFLIAQVTIDHFGYQ